MKLYNSWEENPDVGFVVMKVEYGSFRDIIWKQSFSFSALFIHTLITVLDLLKGSGRAFCAGGDVVTLYRLLSEGLIMETLLHLELVLKNALILSGVHASDIFLLGL